MQAKPGFVWTIDSYSRDGKLIDTETAHNLLPEQGLNHWLSILLKSGTQVGTWYIGLFTEDYTPVPTDTAATLPNDAKEFVGYVGATRKAFNAGDIVGGECNNFDNVTELEFTQDATIRGGFLISSSGKGAASGTLLSVVKFTSPKVREAGEVLKVRAGIGLVSF